MSFNSRKAGTLKSQRRLAVESLEARHLLSATTVPIADLIAPPTALVVAAEELGSVEKSGSENQGDTQARGGQLLRQVERLDRGVIAVRSGASEVYVGWRLLGTDDTTDTFFNLYRAADGGSPVLLNRDPLVLTTDYVDAAAGLDLSVENIYSVRAIVGGIEQPVSGSFALPANSPVQQHLDIPIQTPADGVTPIGESYSYEANDASVGDLDGDGDYEVILKWEPSNKTTNAADGYTGNTLVDAYTMEGQLLWRIDLGINIRSGPHTTQFLVYDFDGDGRSEVVMKTAPGTLDGQGNDVILPGDNPSDDYRETSGFMQGIVISGSEYLTVFDGLTGAELDTIDFPLERGSLSSWGDNFANRADRLLAGVAYLDGVRPSIVWTRGIYGPAAGFTARNEQVALDYRDGQLTQRWRFDAVSGGANTEYVGEGAQSLSTADVDGDGFDEIIYGAAVVDHDGTLLYATELGHGDALHVADIDLTNPGLEVYMPHEGADFNGNVGASLRDAATGTVLFSSYGEGDVGRGLTADVVASSPGNEVWSVYDQTLYAADGTVLGTMPFDSRAKLYNYAIWWDADLSRELLNEDSIYKFDNPGFHSILDAWMDGAAQTNDGKRTPALQADIFGDWREEVIWRNETNTELQIWTTTAPASNRLYTLMHDTQYREAVAWQNVGYNQPPHPSFFLGNGMATPPTPAIFPAGADINLDGTIDGVDIDQLVANIAVGPANPGVFDLTGDGVVDLADRDEWLVLAGAANLPSGNPYLVGDANLDGTVDGGDFLLWNSNKFTSVAAWSAGDLNADGTVDGGDFLLWNANKFQTSDFAASRGVTIPSIERNHEEVADEEMKVAATDWEWLI